MDRVMRPTHLPFFRFNTVASVVCLVCVAFIATGCAPSRTTTGVADASGTASGNEDEASVVSAGFDRAPDTNDAAATAPAAEADERAPEGGDTDDGEDAADDAVTMPAPGPPFDAGEGGVCSAPPGPGDLVIDELMISSVAGTGDHGEWLEVASTLGCALDLRGLHGSAPSGSKVQGFDIGDDLWIPALGTFVVADSSIAAINHDLPGTLVVWAGQPGDVLRNPGSTVTLLYDAIIVDSVTYPSMTLTPGASLTFARDCPPATRGDWTRWQPSAASWFPGFRGTPNAPNDDVRCP
jgi:hypothetical protein